MNILGPIIVLILIGTIVIGGPIVCYKHWKK